MAQTITVDGVDRSGVVHREDATWAESAYLGETGAGKVVYHDDAGTLRAVGFKDVVVDQDECDPPRIFTGFVGKKSIKRGGWLADPGVSREYGFETRDGNDLLSRLKILQASGDRSDVDDDTVGATLQWLVDDELSRVGVLDHGAIDYVTSVGIDAVDRRGQKPGDVLAQLAKSARRNYYVRWHFADPSCPVHGVDDTDSWELVFRDDNTSTDDTATIAISNAGDDDGETVFAPDVDPELSEDPEHVYSRMVVNYAKGREVVEDTYGTADDFVERDGELEDTSVKKAATAARDGTTALWEAHSEEQMLPLTLSMRADQVNLILPGQRVSCRMIHMAPEGWNPARYARVMRRKVTQPQGTDFRYKVQVDLSPQEAGPPLPGDCTDIYPNTATGTYYALGGSTSTLAHPSDGVIQYWRAGYSVPSTPDEAGQIKGCHFPAYGAGGAGTSDYFGDCAQNRCYFVLVGNGTAEIQSAAWPTGARGLRLFKNGVQIQAGASGDMFTVGIDDRTDGDCISVLYLQDNGLVCGGKWGFTQMDWTAA